MDESRNVDEQIKKELIESFGYYSNPEYTGEDPLLPVSRIIFSAQGEITSPPDLEFMGYGLGSEGEAFEACGGLDLTSFFPINDNDYYAEDLEVCFEKACAQVLIGLQAVANSSEFHEIPKQGPVIFILSIDDQVNKVLCRIHPDGQVELPPKK